MPRDLTLTARKVMERVPCPVCYSPAGGFCRPLGAPYDLPKPPDAPPDAVLTHAERWRDADRLAEVIEP